PGTDWRRHAEELLPTGPVYVGLAPGAGGQNKCWPLDRFIDLARAQVAAGRVPVFLLGPGEGDWRDELAAAVPEALIPLQGPSVPAEWERTPIMTVALGERLAAAVANDAGSGHILAAADVPLLSLFGPTDPTKFAPRVSRAHVLRAQEFGDTDAMAAIPATAAAKAIDALIAKN
ncbi:MAG: glycosyltransferase family 9 protein, partial [Alphaproteobacteria bacterium]